MNKKFSPPKRSVKKSNQLAQGKTRTSYAMSRKRPAQISGDIASQVPTWWHKKNLGKEPVQICERCHAVYYDEHWHSWQTAKSLADFFRQGKMAIETLCTECNFIKRGHEGVENYEGEVLLHGLSDLKEKTEILNLIRNVGSRASRRDPEDQIIKIEDKGDTVRVTTTENQLAVSIGKQIDRAHKGGRLEIKFSAVDHPTRVVWKRK